MLSTTQLLKAIWEERKVKISAPILRRAIDLLEFAERIHVQKIGRYRLINPSDQPIIIGELQRQGLIPVVPPASSEVPPC